MDWQGGHGGARVVVEVGENCEPHSGTQCTVVFINGLQKSWINVNIYTRETDMILTMHEPGGTSNTDNGGDTATYYLSRELDNNEQS